VIYFVTPAWQRFDLTKVVLEQRRACIDFLNARGVQAQQVVIADDENADIADSLGFEVIRKRNYALGRRFNDGIAHAARNGAEWIVPIGSDSFLDPAYLFPLPTDGRMRSSTLYALAEPGRLGRLRKRTGTGIGPYMIPRVCLPRTLRPASEVKRRGIDSSTLQGLRLRPRVEFTDLHPWQYVGFRSYPQMNPYDKLYSRIGVSEEPEVVERLSEYYPQGLVERALEACAAVAVAA